MKPLHPCVLLIGSLLAVGLAYAEGAAGVHHDENAMAAARAHLRTHMGGQRFAMAAMERFEYQSHEGDGRWLWDAGVSYGSDLHKLWLKTEGEYQVEANAAEEAELQALYSRAISPYFDLQLGYRVDLEPDPERHFFVLGVQGLAPYWLEVDAAAFVSEDGDLSARVEAEYDLFLTQRLILQPRAEMNLAAQDVSDYGIGSGVSTVEAGLRLRYEFRRQFAPYVGVAWLGRFGETADLAQRHGEQRNAWSVLGGVRFWF